MQFINMKISFKGFLAASFLMLIVFDGEMSFAQSTAPIEMTRPNLLSPDSGWKYQGGIARQEWFDQHFDDQHWLTVNKDFLWLSTENKSWPGICVLRKKFNVPDSLRGQMAELMISQLGASAIYLDGRLVARFGKVSGDEKEERTRLVFIPQHPVQLALDSQSSHVLSVYYSNHTNPSLYRRFGVRGFQILLSAADPEARETNSSFPHDFVSLFMILGFCLFFCFVYGFYPYRLASLMSAIFLAIFSLLFIGNIISNSATDIRFFILGNDFWRISFSCQAGLYLLFLYSLYYGRMPKRSWIVLALIITAAVYGLISTDYSFGVITPMIVLFQIDTWRILILGIRKKRTGFWILAIGMLISILVVLIAVFNIFHFFPWYMTDTQAFFSIFTDLTFPLTLALQFALEFGSANRDLRRQLVQVNDLSEKNLEQEREKQQILSTQNLTLEKQVTERTSEVVAQNKEIEKQRDQVTHTLEELKATQKQLIQTEKMASLGELTAGIAHEIQNPLNFVNNFSEVNAELIDELEKEIDNGNLPQATAIAKDIKENEQKINHHGKRADSIVKGMLQHSKSSTGIKSPADLNALADEYLRLAYHGFKTKEKAFKAAIKTNFDKTIGEVNIVSQEIARVLLNLYNNAFYSVSEKMIINPNGYEPKVEVNTKKTGEMILITVKDNGNGIPEKVMEKIFQPFFTTKPTGQGTGLGLSLSYDIIKAHGGEIKAKTVEGEFAEFVVILPH
jgi:two-component system NtrC family sensor kinase